MCFPQTVENPVGNYTPVIRHWCPKHHAGSKLRRRINVGGRAGSGKKKRLSLHAESTNPLKDAQRYFVALKSPPKTRPKPPNRYQFDRPPGTAPR